MFALITGFMEAGETPQGGIAREIKEETNLSNQARQDLDVILSEAERMAREIGKAKREVSLAASDTELIAQVKSAVKARVTALLDQPYLKSNLYEGMDQIKAEYLLETLGDEPDPAELSRYGKAFDEAQRMIVRDRILFEGKRPDNRKVYEVRDISVETDISPRAHGSGLFTRGETQVLTLCHFGAG